MKNLIQIKKFFIVFLMIVFSFSVFGKIITKELKTQKKKIRILMVVSNPAVSTTTNWPVGFWASELIHPYYEFINVGYEVIIASPKGGKVEFDAYSYPRDKSGYSKSDVLSLGYTQDADFMKLLDNTPKLSDFSAKDFDAIVVVGGQAPMFTFKDEKVLHKLFVDFYTSNKIAACLCHGTSLLIYAKTSDGKYIVKGKTVTGFTNEEEDYVDKTMGTKVMPFRIEDEVKLLGANFIKREPFTPFAVKDGNLITGQQQHSGRYVADLIIDFFNKK